LDALAWLTGLLALATFWLAWTTREMAKSTKQIAALEAQPHLALKEVVIRPGVQTGPELQNPFLNVELRLANPGKVLVRYRMASFRLGIHGQTQGADSAFTNRGGAIHPGSETLFMFPSLHLPHDAPSPVQGRLELDVRYSAVPQEEKSMRATIDLHIHIRPHFDYRWIYSSGPLYSE
jgi:hypothetical protein